MTDSIELYGNAGLYVNDGNAISFQVGEGEQLFSLPSLAVADGEQLPYNEKVWLAGTANKGVPEDVTTHNAKTWRGR